MDLQPLVGDTYTRLASMLEECDPSLWDAPSLCTGWRVREVVAHVTMPARMTGEEFGAEMAAAGGDFQRLSDRVALRDAPMPIGQHLTNLRSSLLAEWQPPGGGAAGALNHAVVHSLDITNPTDLPRACSDEAAVAVLEALTTGEGARHFDIDPSGLRLDADDLSWSWGDGDRQVTAPAGHLISLLSHRTVNSDSFA